METHIENKKGYVGQRGTHLLLCLPQCCMEGGRGQYLSEPQFQPLHYAELRDRIKEPMSAIRSSVHFIL